MSTMEAARVVTLAHVVETIEDVLETQGVATELNGATLLEDLALDSLDFAEIVVRLEEAIGIPLDPESVDGFERVADLTKLRPLRAA